MTENTIIQADCMDVMRDMPDNSVDLVLTDPPYGINFDGETTVFGKSGKAKTFCNYQHHEKKKWDNKTPDKIVFKEMLRIGKSQIVWGGNYFSDKLPVSKWWIYWDKKITNAKNHNFSDGELAWTSFNCILRKFTYDWIGFGYLNNPHKEKKHHPTQKPVALFKWCLDNYSKPNDLIFDPFAGSGTTALASHSMGRRFICVEKEAEYVKVAQQRLADLQAQGDLFTPQVQEPETVQETLL